MPATDWLDVIAWQGVRFVDVIVPIDVMLLVAGRWPGLCVLV